MDDAPVAVDETLTVLEEAELKRRNRISNNTDGDIGDALTLAADAKTGTGTFAISASCV